MKYTFVCIQHFKRTKITSTKYRRRNKHKFLTNTTKALQEAYIDFKNIKCVRLHMGLAYAGNIMHWNSARYQKTVKNARHAVCRSETIFCRYPNSTLFLQGVNVACKHISCNVTLFILYKNKANLKIVLIERKYSLHDPIKCLTF